MSKTGKRIIIGMDGSEHSDKAFNWYLENVHHPDNEVLLTWNIDSVPDSYGNVNLMTGDPDVISRAIKEHTTHIEYMVGKLEQKLVEANVTGRVLQLYGNNSGEVIVQAANREKVDMIVVGSRGLGTLRRTLLGSVSDFVLHHAHVPVFICKFQ